MKGYVFITSSGTDPVAGRHLKDPTLDGTPTFGACQPQIRKQLEPGDHVFVISGSLPRWRQLPQYIVGGLQVDKLLHATEAHAALPEQRLRKLPDGQLTGNVICDADGNPHPLDTHKNFYRRLDNYVVGKSPIVLRSAEEVLRARDGTMRILKAVFNRSGMIPRDIIGRYRGMTGDQVEEMIHLLKQLKVH